MVSSLGTDHLLSTCSLELLLVVLERRHYDSFPATFVALTLIIRRPYDVRI